MENIKHSLAWLVTIPQTVRCTLACTGGVRRRKPRKEEGSLGRPSLGTEARDLLKAMIGRSKRLVKCSA